MLNYACGNYLSNVVEQIDNIIEALYNYDSKCLQQWIIVYYSMLIFTHLFYKKGVY